MKNFEGLEVFVHPTMVIANTHKPRKRSTHPHNGDHKLIDLKKS